MNAKEFNRQYEGFPFRPRSRIGTGSSDQCLSDTKDQTVLALIRFQKKRSAMTQTTHFLLCLRHAFLRTP
jgi:hypothetical protein